MSHFNLLVLVPANTKSVKDAVAKLMDPYSEGKDLPEYETNCYCIGKVAQREAQEAAERVFKSWDELRKEFHKKHPEVDGMKKEWDKRWKESEKLSLAEKKALKKAHKSWDNSIDLLFQAFIAPKQNFIDEFAKNHPMAKKPDPTCGFYSQSLLDDCKKKEPEKYKNVKVGDRYEDLSGCGATGRIKSTSNPKGEWDWYEIGGRWTADMSEDYDPYTDPDNFEKCQWCSGTGRREDAIGAQMNPKFHCNGCDGKGRSLKHSLKAYDGDILPTSKVPKDYVPHALLTPDGKWHQEAIMGWFGMTGKKDPNWDEKVAGILKKHAKDTKTVLVDCHT